jgi:hypothetical protein
MTTTPPAPERHGLELKLVMAIGPHWENVDLLRTAILNCVAVIVGDGDASHSVGMIVSELLENAIKYGDWTDDESSLLGLHISGNTEVVEVDVSSPMKQGSKNFDEIKKTIEWIRSFPSPKEAYFERIRELAEGGTKKKSRMGLVRIAYEGPCSIQPELQQDGLLHMKATAHLPDDAARSSVRSMHINVTSSSS